MEVRNHRGSNESVTLLTIRSLQRRLPMSPRFLAPMCAMAAILLAAMPAAGQSKSPAKSAKSWTPPRTPWGDPDLQGWFSNLNEDGTPLERPEQFAGRSLDDIKPAELAAIRRGIQQRTLSNFEGPLH